MAQQQAVRHRTRCATEKYTMRHRMSVLVFGNCCCPLYKYRYITGIQVYYRIYTDNNTNKNIFWQVYENRSITMWSSHHYLYPEIHTYGVTSAEFLHKCLIQKFIMSHVTNEMVTAYTRIKSSTSAMMVSKSGSTTIMEPSSSWAAPGTVYTSLSSSTSCRHSATLGVLRCPSGTTLEMDWDIYWLII